MSTDSRRWAAASGYVVVLFGMAGAAFERGGPPLNGPADQTLAFFTTYRRELLYQSLMFVLSAGAYLWFFGVLRTFLLQAEGAPGMLSTIAFGAGIVNAGIQMVFQGLQVALAAASHDPVDPTVAALFSDAMFALSVIGYIPWAVMLAAVAVVSIGLVAGNGPLVPGGVLTYGLYAVSLVWLVATTTVMVVRSGRRYQFETVNSGGLSRHASLPRRDSHRRGAVLVSHPPVDEPVGRRSI